MKSIFDELAKSLDSIFDAYPYFTSFFKSRENKRIKQLRELVPPDNKKIIQIKKNYEQPQSIKSHRRLQTLRIRTRRVK